MNLSALTTDHRIRRSLGVALCAGLLAVTAACSSSSGQTSSTTGGNTSSAGGSASTAISGKRFVLMFQSTQAPGEVIEMHAISLLKKEGVKASAKWNASTSNVAITQLTNGDIQAYSQAVTGAVSAALAGVKIMDFALAQPRQDYVLLAKSSISSLADLKGKTIGVSSITGVNYAQALLVLGKAGLTAKDVHIVVAGGQSVRVSGLAAGRVDATMLNHAAAKQLEPKGFHVLFDYTKQASNLYDDNVFATPSWLAKNGAVAVAFNKALLQSFQWFNDPANVDDVVTEAKQLDSADSASDLKSQFATLRAAGWAPDGSILNTTLLNQQQQLYAQTKAISATLPVSKWATDMYALQAQSGS